MGFVVLAWIVFGFIAGTIASGKGRSFGSYFICGVLLGPIGIICAACASNTPEAEANRLQQVQSHMTPMPAPTSSLEGLTTLIGLHRDGVLSDEEFTAAKRRTLGLPL